MKRAIYISIFLAAGIVQADDVNNYEIKVLDVKVGESSIPNQIILKSKSGEEYCVNSSIFDNLNFKKQIKKYERDISNNKFICFSEGTDFEYKLEGDVFSVYPNPVLYPDQRFTNIRKGGYKPDHVSTLFSLGYDADVVSSNVYDNTVHEVELTPFVSGKYGVLSGGATVSNIEGKEKLNRDYVNYRYDDYERKITYEAGDIITSSQGQRLGILGLQIKKNYELDPDFITVPTLKFGEQIALPSSIDMYINNQKREHKDVRTGLVDFDYYLRNNGEGDVRFEITDKLGRTKVVTFSLYNYNKLLKKGLSAYKVNVGKVRKISQRYENPKYGDTVVSGSYRRGLTNSVTAGMDSMKIGDAYYNSASLNTTLFNYASLFLTAGYGKKKDLDTKYYEIRVARNSPYFKLLFGYKRKTGELTDHEYLRMDRNRVIASVKIPLSWGSVTTSYSRREDHRGEKLEYYTAETAIGGMDSVLKGGVLNFRVSYQKAPYKDYVASVFFSMPLGGDAVMRSKFSQSDKYGAKEAMLEYSKKANLESRVDYTAGIKKYYDDKALYGNTAYYGDKVKLKAGAYIGENTKRVYAGAEGSVNLIDGYTNMSRGRDASMALVSTVPDVAINVNGKHYGKTDSSGKLMVSDLSRYHKNYIDVDVRTMGSGAVLKDDEANVFVGYKTGHRIDFDTESLRDYSFYVTDTGMTALNMSGMEFLAVDSKGKTVKGIIGRDGMAYVSGIAPGPLRMSFDFGNKSCELVADVPKQPTNEIKSFSCDITDDILEGNEKRAIKMYLNQSKEEYRHNERDYSEGGVLEESTGTEYFSPDSEKKEERIEDLEDFDTPVSDDFISNIKYINKYTKEEGE